MQPHSHVARPRGTELAPINMHERVEPDDGQSLRWWTAPEDRTTAASGQARRSWNYAPCFDCGSDRMGSVVGPDGGSGNPSPQRIVLGIPTGLWSLWTIPVRSPHLH